MADACVYRTGAIVSGGRRDGRGRLLDSSFEVNLAAPRNPSAGLNPEQLFALGYAACFGSAVQSVARRHGAPAKGVEVQSEVTLIREESGAYSLAVSLDVGGLGDDHERSAILVREAHEICPYSRAVAGNVPVALFVSGRSLDSIPVDA